MELQAATALLTLALQARDSEPRREPAPGSVIGNYCILGKQLGAGGAGTVYPATHVRNGGAFALKLARPGVPERIFLEERHKARVLNHPHILVAYDGGSWEGRPFLVFRRLEGHFTDAVRRERYAEPRAILGVMRKLAAAVAFAHGRAVLHCDLKPSNILFDSQHEPHIADFGLARTIEASGSFGEAWGGTRGWMSREQVDKGAIDNTSDVFTLGVLLYWLLCGVLPFGQGKDFDERVRVGRPAPIPAQRRWDSALAWDLAAICKRALRLQPEESYQSANELEADLERAAQGRLPLAAGSRAWLSRPTRWARRRPALALAALVTLGLPGYALWLQHGAIGEVRSVLRPHNRFTAKAQARAVVSELYSMSLRVHAMARDPAVLSLLEHPNIGVDARPLEPHVAGFDSVNVFAIDGSHRARWPAAAPELALNVESTNLFGCALRMAEERQKGGNEPQAPALEVCVAKAHRSHLDGKVKLGLSAPLFDGERLVGVAEASTMARDRFGALQMSCGPGDCFTALLGPRDRDLAAGSGPAGLSILAQQGVGLGQEVQLPSAVSREICDRLECEPHPTRPFDPELSEPFELDPYVDPISSARTLAVLAPVARTGLSVLIATPHSATDAQLTGIAAVAARGAWLPVLFGFAAWLLLLLAPNPRWPWGPSRTPPRKVRVEAESPR
jgi:hypothetical protein